MKLIKLNASSRANEFISLVANVHPQIHEVLREALRIVPDQSQAIGRYQAALLYFFAAQYNGDTIVELGTRVGYSTAVLSFACPDSRIFTVDTNALHLEQARRNLVDFDNIQFVHMPSWDFAEKANDGKIGLVFVDADHQQTQRDLVWWPKVKTDGLMLFHDYTPNRFPEVVSAVDHLAQTQRPDAPPDIVCFGGNGNGMAGVYKTG